jgi:hypothetical protein
MALACISFISAAFTLNMVVILESLLETTCNPLVRVMFGCASISLLLYNIYQTQKILVVTKSSTLVHVVFAALLSLRLGSMILNVVMLDGTVNANVTCEYDIPHGYIYQEHLASFAFQLCLYIPIVATFYTKVYRRTSNANKRRSINIETFLATLVDFEVTSFIVSCVSDILFITLFAYSSTIEMFSLLNVLYWITPIALFLVNVVRFYVSVDVTRKNEVQRAVLRRMQSAEDRAGFGFVTSGVVVARFERPALV